MNIFRKIKEKVYHLHDSHQLREAIKTADKAHSEKGNRYYVMPSKDGKLIVVDRKNFRLLRMKHYIPQDARMQDALNSCFYHTPHSNGSGIMPNDIMKIKSELFFSWKRSLRKK